MRAFTRRRTGAASGRSRSRKKRGREDADVGAVLRVRRNRDVEVVLADVAADGEHLPLAGAEGVADLDVVGLRTEVELKRLPRRRIDQQQVGRLRVGEI